MLVHLSQFPSWRMSLQQIIIEQNFWKEQSHCMEEFLLCMKATFSVDKLGKISTSLNPIFFCKEQINQKNKIAELRKREKSSMFWTQKKFHVFNVLTSTCSFFKRHLVLSVSIYLSVLKTGLNFFKDALKYFCARFIPITFNISEINVREIQHLIFLCDYVILFLNNSKLPAANCGKRWDNSFEVFIGAKAMTNTKIIYWCSV